MAVKAGGVKNSKASVKQLLFTVCSPCVYTVIRQVQSRGTCCLGMPLKGCFHVGRDIFCTCRWKGGKTFFFLKKYRCTSGLGRRNFTFHMRLPLCLDKPHQTCMFSWEINIPVRALNQRKQLKSALGY